MFKQTISHESLMLTFA